MDTRIFAFSAKCLTFLAILPLACLSRNAQAAPTMYNLDAAYNSNGAEGSLAISFTLDPNAAPARCDTPATTTYCYWDFTASVTSTGTYSFSAGSPTLFSTSDYFQYVFNGTPGASIELQATNGEGIDFDDFPDSLSNVQIASLPLGTTDMTITLIPASGGPYYVPAVVTLSTTPVPEPSTIGLVVVAIAGIGVMRRLLPSAASMSVRE